MFHLITSLFEDLDFFTCCYTPISKMENELSPKWEVGCFLDKINMFLTYLFG